MYLFKFLIGFNCLSFLFVSFCGVFNRWVSCNALYKLLELSLCYLIFDLLLDFNLLMTNASLQPLGWFSSLPMDLLLLSESSAE